MGDTTYEQSEKYLYASHEFNTMTRKTSFQAALNQYPLYTHYHGPNTSDRQGFIGNISSNPKGGIAYQKPWTRQTQ